MRKNTFLICLFFSCLAWSTAAWAAEKDDEISKSYFKDAKRYRFKVDAEYLLPEHLKGEKLPIRRLEAELDRFFKVLDLLGENFVRKSGLKQVVICRNLNNGKRKLNGHVYKDCIYLTEGFKPETVYHELYHVLDNKDSSKDWLKCNDPAFRYRGSSMENPAVKTRFDGGFVSAYARASEREDRAETFSAMITQGPEFTLRAQKNPVLYAKMQYIIKQTGTASLLGRNYWLNRLGMNIIPPKKKNPPPKPETAPLTVQIVR